MNNDKGKRKNESSLANRNPAAAAAITSAKLTAKGFLYITGTLLACLVAVGLLLVLLTIFFAPILAIIEQANIQASPVPLLWFIPLTMLYIFIPLWLYHYFVGLATRVALTQFEKSLHFELTWLERAVSGLAVTFLGSVVGSFVNRPPRRAFLHLETQHKSLNYRTRESLSKFVSDHIWGSNG